MTFSKDVLHVKVAVMFPIVILRKTMQSLSGGGVVDVSGVFGVGGGVCLVGCDVGCAVGIDVGVAVGIDVGAAVGIDVGVAVGIDVGFAVGIDVDVDASCAHSSPRL